MDPVVDVVVAVVYYVSIVATGHGLSKECRHFAISCVLRIAGSSY